MNKPDKVPRRVMLYCAGRRAQKLRPFDAANAWNILAHELEQLGERDVPKFKDLFQAIRIATIKASK